MPAAPAPTSRPASTAATPDSRPYEVEVFFDGDCPLCRREIGMLRRWDKRSAIRFTDIAGEGFRADSVGVPLETLMAHIHGRLPDGRLITGVEVFRRLYAAVGLGWLVGPTRLPGVRHTLDAAYGLFARWRRPAGRLLVAVGLGRRRGVGPRELAGERCGGACDASPRWRSRQD